MAPETPPWPKIRGRAGPFPDPCAWPANSRLNGSKTRTSLVRLIIQIPRRRRQVLVRGSCGDRIVSTLVAGLDAKRSSQFGNGQRNGQSATSKLSCKSIPYGAALDGHTRYRFAPRFDYRHR